MAQRRKRRSKAEIEAEKAAKAALAAEEAKMKEAGYEKVHARNAKGHFIKDDPATPENEAWEWVKKDEEVKNDDVVTEMVEESVASAEVVEEAPAKRVKPADHKPKPKPKAKTEEEPQKEGPSGWAARFRARRDARGK